jgi:hypothetical protein
MIDQQEHIARQAMLKSIWESGTVPSTVDRDTIKSYIKEMFDFSMGLINMGNGRPPETAQTSPFKEDLAEVAESPTDAIEPSDPSEEKSTPKHWPHPAEARQQKAGCISEKQAKRLFAIAKQAGWGIKALQTKLKVQDFMDIPWRSYENICKQVEKGPQ